MTENQTAAAPQAKSGGPGPSYLNLQDTVTNYYDQNPLSARKWVVVTPGGQLVGDIAGVGLDHYIFHVNFGDSTSTSTVFIPFSQICFVGLMAANNTPKQPEPPALLVKNA